MRSKRNFNFFLFFFWHSIKIFIVNGMEMDTVACIFFFVFIYCNVIGIYPICSFLFISFLFAQHLFSLLQLGRHLNAIISNKQFCYLKKFEYVNLIMNDITEIRQLINFFFIVANEKSHILKRIKKKKYYKKSLQIYITC